MSVRTLRIAALLLCLGALSGCYVEDEGPCDTCGAPAYVAPTLDSLTLAPADLLVRPGDDVQYVVTAHYSDGSTADLTSEAVWSSSNDAVASVSNVYGSWGYASAWADGPTTITASLPEGDISTNLDVDISAPLQGKTAPQRSTTVQVTNVKSATR